MRHATSVLDLIGNTPLVELRHVLPGAGDATVLAKLEYLNPGGSVKDRIGVALIREGERTGALRAGGTIVEPTSGNTGVGLALAAQQFGYRCVFVCPDKVSEDKIGVLRAFGARVVVCPTALPPEHPDSYYSVSDRLAEEIPGAWKPDQYANAANPRAHLEVTGPEIWRQTEGQVTHFVCGIGTGGTISGAGRYLKDVSDGRVRVIGADPVGSVYSGGDGRPYLVEGVGEDFWPATFDAGVCDEVVAVSDEDSFRMTRRLAREEGLLAGGSSGMATMVALDAARRAAPGAVVVVLLPDGGRGYLTKIFNNRWLSSAGFEHDDTAAEGGAVARAILEHKRRAAPEANGDVVYFTPKHTLAEAIDTMTRLGISQAPVMCHAPPASIAEVSGAVAERGLLRALASGLVRPEDPIDLCTDPPLATLAINASVEQVVSALREHGAALVVDAGLVRGVLTLHDALQYLSATNGARAAVGAGAVGV